MTAVEPQDPDFKGHRSGYVALIGKPNAGKSTLMNALIGSKLSIVTAKPQTTRQRILGIANEPEFQIIFLDIPGVIEPRYGLQQAMMKSVRHAVQDADLMLFIADATKESPDELSLAEIQGRPAILVLNKMDLIDTSSALPLVQRYVDLRAFEEVVPVSAKKGTNLEVLMEAVVSRLPVGPPFYPKDVLSEQPERFFVAEIVREKIFVKFGKEIPYSTQVNVVAFDEKNEYGKDVIDAEIIVERESQKPIILGKGGKAIKSLGISSRKAIESFLGRPVHLRLFVKVRKGWRDSTTHLRSYGYE